MTVRSSPVSLFLRKNAGNWLALADMGVPADNSPDTTLVLQTLSSAGALFFSEMVTRTNLLPSRVEQALGELVAQGWVTSDSFEGLRALLMPSEKRFPFADPERRRRHKAVTSVEFAGRWSLLRWPPPSPETPKPSFENNSVNVSAGDTGARELAVEAFARALLRRYGIMFRRLLEREALKVSWFELGRIYRRLEARGEIRGGYFVSGVSGEQFALPEAIGLLRSIRKSGANNELIVISGADPLNLSGILTPGPRVPAIAPNRILLRDGVPVAAMEGGNIFSLEPGVAEPDPAFKRALVLGTLPARLRKYYG